MADLEGAAVLGGHDVAHLVHHVAEALHLLRRAEALRTPDIRVAATIAVSNFAQQSESN